jgi:ribonuclease HI
LVLVLLIGGALLFSIGPFDTSDGGSSPRPRSALERQAERAEGQLATDHEDKKLLLAVMQAWIEAGNDRLSKVDTRTQPIPSAVSEDFGAGLRAWNHYLRQTGGKAGADIAELAGDTFFKLVEIGSTDPSEAEANAAGAARALRIAGKLRPTLYTLSNLAVYEYFDGEYAAGDRAAEGAAADIRKSESKSVIEQLDEYRERAERFNRRVKRGTETLRESDEAKLPVPIKGYGSPAGLNGVE